MAPLWLDAAGPSDRARALAAVLRDAGQDGPRPGGLRSVGDHRAARGGRRPTSARSSSCASASACWRSPPISAAGRLEPHQVNPELFIHPPEVDPGRGDPGCGRRPGHHGLRRGLRAAAAGVPAPQGGARRLSRAGRSRRLDDGRRRPDAQARHDRPAGRAAARAAGGAGAAGRRCGAVRSCARAGGQGSSRRATAWSRTASSARTPSRR